MKFATLACASAFGIVLAAPASAAVIYDSIPSPLPPSVASEGYQCCQISQLGDEIGFAGTARNLSTITVTLNDWATYSTYAANPAYSANAVSWTAALTLTLYAVDDSGPTPVVGSVIASKAINPDILWRPEANASCGSGFIGSDGQCYNGLAQNVAFDFTGTTVPDKIIFGLSFNTQTYGETPTGEGGPYDSLNFGFNQFSGPTVGLDENGDAIFIDSKGAGLTDATPGTFSQDTGWAPYVPAIRFEATAAPEPATLALLGTGLAGMFAMRRRRKA